jgi:hypothetical protein
MVYCSWKNNDCGLCPSFNVSKKHCFGNRTQVGAPIILSEDGNRSSFQKKFFLETADNG